MKSTKLSKMYKGLQLMLIKNSPEILIGLGITGMAMTTVLAVRATPKALGLLEDERDSREAEWEETGVTRQLTKIDVVKVTYKCYIPALITGLVSSSCIIGANSVNTRRNAALATAYTLSETALKEYREKVIETIGEKKEELVRDSIAKDKIDRDPINNREIIMTGNGDTLCYDSISKRYFKSNINKLKSIENDLNKRLRNEMFISVNDYYYEIGLKALSSVGDDIGWDIQDGDIEFDFRYAGSDDGDPCIVIDFRVEPRAYTRSY